MRLMVVTEKRVPVGGDYENKSNRYQKTLDLKRSTLIFAEAATFFSLP